LQGELLGTSEDGSEGKGGKDEKLSAMPLSLLKGGGREELPKVTFRAS